MAARAVLIWFVLLGIAILNGAFRESILIPRFSRPAAHAISTLILCSAIALIAWSEIGWVAPRTLKEAWGVGALWLTLTLAFEFLAGHYLFRKPWEALLADYNILGGRIWILVLVVTLLSPVLTFVQRHANGVLR